MRDGDPEGVRRRGAVERDDRVDDDRDPDRQGHEQRALGAEPLGEPPRRTGAEHGDDLDEQDQLQQERRRVVAGQALRDEQLLLEHDRRQRDDRLDRVVEEQERQQEARGAGQRPQRRQGAAQLPQRAGDLAAQALGHRRRVPAGQLADGVEPAHGDGAERRPPHGRQADREAHRRAAADAERVGGGDQHEGEREHEGAARVAGGEAEGRDAVAVGQLGDVGEVGVVGQDRRAVRDVGDDERGEPGQDGPGRGEGQRDRGRRPDGRRDHQQPALGERSVGQRAEHRQRQHLQQHRQADGVGEQRPRARREEQDRDPVVRPGDVLRQRREERPADGGDHGGDEGGVRDVVQREARDRAAARGIERSRRAPVGSGGAVRAVQSPESEAA